MKFSGFALLSIVALVSALPQADPNLPACGADCMLPAIQSSGCGFTNAECLCANDGFMTAYNTCLPSKCTTAEDLSAYSGFINTQCTGQTGYPITVGAAPAAPTA